MKSNKIRLKKNITKQRLIIYRFFVAFYLKHLGNTTLRDLSVNDEDLNTMQNVMDIPNAYLFCISDGGEIYSFDIRTLYKMHINNNSFKIKNPYTSNIICSEMVHEIIKKLNFISHLGFPIDYINHINDKIIPNDIIHKLHMLDFDLTPKIINNLSFNKLKKLYFILKQNWESPGIPDTIKNTVLDRKKEYIFNNYKYIHDLKSNVTNSKYLLEIMYSIIARFITEGRTKDDKKLGALYFISSLIIISPEAKKLFPYLN